MMTLGAQLYTVKDHCKDLDSFAESLKRIADIGYTTVQVSGTCAFEPTWLAERLRETGLTCVLTHVKAAKIEEDAARVCDEHKTFGCRNIGLGVIPGGKNITIEKYDSFVKSFKPLARALRENGCKLFYHNHCEEFNRFADGETCMDKMVRDFAADELNFTLDTYWVQYAGCDSADMLRRLKGRVECIHLKDMTIDSATWEHRMAPVGHGNMDFEKILRAASEAETRYLLVEQDDCYGADPFECLQKSYRYLTSMGLK